MSSWVSLTSFLFRDTIIIEYQIKYSPAQKRGAIHIVSVEADVVSLRHEP